MTEMISDNRLLSHNVSAVSCETSMQEITERVRAQGDKPYVTVEQQLRILKELSEFDFGRYLLQHKGVNGYWTHYMLTHPWFGRKTGLNNRGEKFSNLENFLLNRAPTMLATQQRFQIFLTENQKSIKNHAQLACIPCGMMGELLYLDYQNIKDIELFGIDYDYETLNDAKSLAQEKNLLPFTTMLRQDAWQIDNLNQFDLISSNGLTIYEPDDHRVQELYQIFYRALKPNGQLVTSFLTLPPGATDQCEWNFSCINQDDLLLQKIIFVDILEAKWQCFRSTEQTRNQLIAAGFSEVEFSFDTAKMFPTVIAYK